MIPIFVRDCKSRKRIRTTMSKSSVIKKEYDSDRLRESCRVCLVKIGTIKIFEDSTILSKIKTCAPIQIDQLDGLPDSLCKKCSKDLDVAFEFYEKCMKSDERLQEAFQRDLNTNVEVKLEPKEEVLSLEGKFSVPVVKKEEPAMYKNDIQALVKSISSRSGLQIRKAPAHREKLERNTKEIAEVEVKHEGNLNDGENTADLTWQDADDSACHNNNDDSGKPKSKRKKKRKYEEVIYVYVCDLCHLNFSDKEKFEEHINVHKNETYECVKCKKIIKGTKRIEIHKKSHDNKTLPCEFCGKVYNKQQLQRHVASTHMKELVCECDICGKKFTAKNSLKVHIKRAHHNSGPEICSHCGKEYASKLSLKLHIDRVHINKKPHLCSFCGHAFHSSKDKKEHENLHTGVKPFECPLCGKAFTQRCNMKSHFVHNHREYDFKLAMELYKNRKADDRAVSPASLVDVISESVRHPRLTSRISNAH